MRRSRAWKVMNIMKLHSFLLGVLPAALLLLSPEAQADEVVILTDNTKIVAKVEHFYDGMLTLKLPGGTAMQLPVAKVKRIEFQLPKPRPEFATPQKAFDRLRKAALKGDLETYIDCHSAYYQMFLGHQVSISTPKKFASRLKQEWGAIQLEVLETKVENDTAVMKVRRKQGDNAQDGEMRFVKENNEWKMILPL